MRGSYSGNTLAFQANAESSILLPRSKDKCPGGEIGRHVGLRSRCESVTVRVRPRAPNVRADGVIGNALDLHSRVRGSNPRRSTKHIFV